MLCSRARQGRRWLGVMANRAQYTNSSRTGGQVCQRPCRAGPTAMAQTHGWARWPPSRRSPPAPPQRHDKACHTNNTTAAVTEVMLIRQTLELKEAVKKNTLMHDAAAHEACRRFCTPTRGMKNCPVSCRRIIEKRTWLEQPQKKRAGAGGGGCSRYKGGPTHQQRKTLLSVHDVHTSSLSSWPSTSSFVLNASSGTKVSMMHTSRPGHTVGFCFTFWGRNEIGMYRAQQD